MRERETARKRERKRGRERDSEKERETARERQRERDREREIQKDREFKREVCEESLLSVCHACGLFIRSVGHLCYVDHLLLWHFTVARLLNTHTTTHNHTQKHTRAHAHTHTHPSQISGHVCASISVSPIKLN